MDKSRFRKLITDPSSLGIALLCCSIIFAAVEIRYPHFFMRGDNADWYLSEYIFSNRCILEGKFPLYCFNEFCGQRYFASGQTGVLNPLISFAAVTSMLICGKPDLMIDILAFLSILIGCTGSWFLLKKLGCTDLAAVIGSIAWNFNCYNIWQGTGWILVVFATSVFPYFLLTSTMLIEKTSIRNLILAIVPRVYLLYLGHPQFFIFASVFDCMFIVVLLLLKSRKSRFGALLRLIRDYLIIYVSTAILALPLLIPEYRYTQMSFGYGSERSVDSLIETMGFESPAFIFPFLYTEDNYITFYPPYVGILLSAFLIAGIFLPLLLFKGNIKPEYKDPVKVVIAGIPCLALGFLMLFNMDFLKIILQIPILNRFQYYHRISIYYAAFEVIIACLSLTVTGNLLKDRFAKAHNPGRRIGSVIKCSVICVEMLSFALLYTVTPHIGRGVLFDTSKLYDYGFAEIIAGGRYVTFGYTSNSHLINKEVYDLSESLDYNLNKLYKINNVSGYVYDVISSNVIDDNECFDHMVYFSGSVFESWPDMIGQMREQSVCWYIVNPGSRTEFESCLDGYGLEYVSETAHSVIYYDPCSQPYAYDAEENKVDLTQDINSLVMHTADSFNGGKITLNYTYDPNFRCYIDGKPAELTNEPGKWQFYTECGPGEHEIIVRYEDQTFNVCCIITGAYIILAGAGIIVYTKIRKRSKTREVCS